MKQQTHTTNTTETQTDPAAVSQPTLPGIDPAPQPADEVMTLTETLALLDAENRSLKQQLRIGDAQVAMTAALTDAGAHSPELLFQVVKGELEFDDTGKSQNVTALVDKLKESYPEQFRAAVPPSIDAGAGQAPTQRLTRSALAKMKPSEIADLDWSDVRRALAAS